MYAQETDFMDHMRSTETSISKLQDDITFLRKSVGAAHSKFPLPSKDTDKLLETVDTLVDLVRWQHKALSKIIPALGEVSLALDLELELPTADRTDMDGQL